MKLKSFTTIWIDEFSLDEATGAEGEPDDGQRRPCLNNKI